MDWFVYSLEHRAWWRSGHWGYTKLAHEAGRYSLDAAVEICRKANIGRSPNAPPMEAMVPAPEKSEKQTPAPRSKRSAGAIADGS